MDIRNRLSKKELRMVEEAVDDAWETGHDLGDEAADIFMEDGIKDGEAAASYYWDLLSYGADWKEYRVGMDDDQVHEEEGTTADQVTLEDLLNLPSANRTVYDNLVDYFDGNGDEDAVQKAIDVVNSDYDDPWSLAAKRELRKLLEEHKVAIKSDYEQGIRNYLNQGQDPASADITVYGIDTELIVDNHETGEGDTISDEMDNGCNGTYGWKTTGAHSPGFKDLLMEYGMDLGEDNCNCMFYNDMADDGRFNRLVVTNVQTEEGYEVEDADMEAFKRGDINLVNVHYTVLTDMTKEQAEYAGFPVA